MNDLAEPADAELLDYAGVATLTGLAASTLRQYRANGRMPEPDAMPAPDRPRWTAATIRAWVAARPGRGAPGRPRRRKATQAGGTS